MEELRRLVKCLIVSNDNIAATESLLKLAKIVRAEAERKIIERKGELGLGATVDIEGVAVVKFQEMVTTKLADRDAFSKWIEEHDLKHLGNWNIHSSRIKALTIERMQAGDAVPDGIDVGRWIKIKLE